MSPGLIKAGLFCRITFVSAGSLAEDPAVSAHRTHNRRITGMLPAISSPPTRGAGSSARDPAGTGKIKTLNKYYYSFRKLVTGLLVR